MVRDTIWQISTGYFGCRDKKGNFDLKLKRRLKKIMKMIEIKLSQGAKPGHGGMLLAPKVTQEIAETRGIETNQDCISPAKHSEFNNPAELLKFVEKLRKISGGKPIGIKLCVGQNLGEIISIIKTMTTTKKAH